jgi:peptide/nickel transport system ATP-binding protein
VMSKGVAVERGPIDRVISAPQHPYTAQLVGSARALDDMLGST